MTSSKLFSDVRSIHASGTSMIVDPAINTAYVARRDSGRSGRIRMGIVLKRDRGFGRKSTMHEIDGRPMKPRVSIVGRMTRGVSWLTRVTLLIAWAAAGAFAAEARRPNILFLTADDMSFDSLGVTGCKLPDI